MLFYFKKIYIEKFSRPQGWVKFYRDFRGIRHTGDHFVAKTPHEAKKEGARWQERDSPLSWYLQTERNT